MSYNLIKKENVFHTHASAPLFFDGKLKNEFYKERINGETWVADEFAKKYY